MRVVVRFESIKILAQKAMVSRYIITEEWPASLWLHITQNCIKKNNFQFYESGLSTRGDLAKRGGWLSNVIKFVAPIIRWWIFGKRTSETLPLDGVRNVAFNAVSICEDDFFFSFVFVMISLQYKYK